MWQKRHTFSMVYHSNAAILPRNRASLFGFHSPMPHLSPSHGFGLSSFKRRGGRRILSQVIIGAGVALACLYVLRMLGVEIGRLDLLIACGVGISLVIVGVKLRTFRRVGRF